MRLAFALLSIVALACAREDPAPDAPPAPPEAEAVADACAGFDADAVVKVLIDGCTTSPAEDARPLATATWKPTHRGSLDAVPIVITSKGAELNNRPFDPIDLYGALEMQRSRGHARDVAFVLAIHGDAKLSDVQPVLAELADAKANKGVLVFASSTAPRTPKPLHPEIHARLLAKREGFSKAERARETALAMEPLTAPCPQVKQVYERVATMPRSERCEPEMKGIAAAIIACDCPSWAPELVTWVQIMAGPTDAPRVHADAVTIDPERGSSIDPSTTWASYVAQRNTPIDVLWLAP
ncbi:MAG TPA: hypothetical protein VG755_22725 [Nannocystaceae bacterium]|nr:hypothetical protein [Nannocystaceae bacterium]